MLGRSDGVLNRMFPVPIRICCELTLSRLSPPLSSPSSLITILATALTSPPQPHSRYHHHRPAASGIRFGSSELYEVLDTFSPSAAVLNGASPSLNIIEDSLVVGQKTLDGADERVVLFVKLVDDEVLGDELLKEIKTRIRST